MRGTFGWMLLVVAMAATTGVAVVVAPAAAIAVVLLFWAVLLATLSPGAVVLFAVVVGTWALPAQIPTSVEVAGRTLFLTEPVLAAAALYALAALPPKRRILGGATLLTGALVVSTMIGLLNGNDSSAILSDVRAPLAMVLAFVIAAQVQGTPLEPKALRVVKWGLWWSAALTVLALVGLIQLGGRTETSELVLEGGEIAGGGALRVMTTATHPALAVVCACAALVVLRRASIRQTLPYLAPALVITFASQSRNSLLGIAAAVLFAFLVSRSKGAAAGALLRGGVVVGALAGILVLAASVLTLPGEEAVTNQVESFRERVVGGLSTEVRSADSSLQYRVRENRYLMEAFDTAPFVGHGMGYAYQPPSGAPGSFYATTGRVYSHNFYYWLLAKAGLLGALAFAAFVLPLLGRRVPADVRGPIGAAAVGLLAVSVVAPMPLSQTGSIALGALLGLLAGARSATALDAATETAVRPAVRAGRRSPVGVR